MFHEAIAAVMVATLVVHTQAQTCKDPLVEKRLLADDVRYASPFYVIALPKNPRTEQMDNVCYTYYEDPDKGTFFHIMSITFKDGSNEYHTYSKGDLADRMGLAEAKALAESNCLYHDYTLTPICNVSVFILYRCFIQGNCAGIDIGSTPGMDVRVVLAANPKVSPECIRETEMSLKDTSKLAGDGYIVLPQKLKPQCVTRYNNTNSIGHERAVGSKEVTENELSERFGTDNRLGSSDTAPTSPAQGTWPPRNPASPNRNTNTPSGNRGGAPVKGQTSSYGNPYAGPQATGRPGYTPVPAWSHNNGQWNSGPSPWNGQTTQPNSEKHYHTWQSSSTVGMNKNPNVFYHIHSWDSPPPGCCRCN